ncbi:ABC transporter ATP-binding protein [Halalkalibacter hemicellulosilyticus]|uniref:Nitrate ABC transporter n=1 Tax=Halalkalibacter hemicellulosilyticusJCM 9152 TaxID=1236971 RepID=W4QE85_9BACI|nr:ABC transporter ATP-binding protein [Halalkalibacter hemicellulosilyticus]GAE29968.1 nitrate ABC transporter [Halalkalibacter hemicellulosilyticusJCM 9152]
MSYLNVESITKVFPTKKGDFQALDTVHLSVEKGEFVSLIGHSGCGKSTVLNIIAGLETPTTGQIILDHQVVKGPGPERGVVFQNYSLLPWLSVYGNVYEVVDAVFPSYSKAEKKSIVEHYLSVVGLWKHRHKRPDEISGGMKQRAAIARAFAVRPQVLLLDEPFGALDALTRATLQDELIHLIKPKEEEGAKTVIMVTHDIDEAIYLSDRVVVMTNGPAATIDTVIDIPLERPRTRKDIIHEKKYNELKEELLEYLHGSPAHV